MKNDRHHHETQSGDAEGREKRLDDLLAEYVDRANSGENVDRETILRAHPTLGPEILMDLEAFLELSPPVETQSLGTLGDYTLRRHVVNANLIGLTRHHR